MDVRKCDQPIREDCCVPCERLAWRFRVFITQNGKLEAVGKKRRKIARDGVCRVKCTRHENPSAILSNVVAASI